MALTEYTNQKSWDKAATARDSEGNAWDVQEAQMANKKGEILKRLPAHRAFWFGWQAAFPDTQLIN